MADWCDWAFSHWPVDQMHMTALPEAKANLSIMCVTIRAAVVLIAVMGIW